MLATRQIEEVLCKPEAIGSVEALMPPVPDAWTVAFPDLTSLPTFNGEQRRLQVCIATEDIVGPVRNGGIGTTYAALADLLVALGHDTTILYLRGQDVENGDVGQWVDYYAERGVRFVPVPNYAVMDDFRTGADRWLRAPYNMLRYLLINHMDVVHVSEWRGSGYLSLLAKRQGLAFQNTLFVVKTSSPWMWNRLYGSHPLERLEDLAKIHAERQSVELADMVVGGSLHLLRWMSSQGYRLPRERTFVQPNVMNTDHIADLIGRRVTAAGSRIPIEEFVFFGRLEARKGLLTFCQAIRRLVRMGAKLPPRITFMGKAGARLTVRPDQSVLEFIEAESAGWPTQVQVLSDFQQYQALDYLLDGPRLAVMPSTIENSSMAVYEAAICGIPFVASATGGTPELVAAVDRPHVLCDPHPIPLAEKLSEVLAEGGYVARPSFENEANRETWRGFHANLGRGLLPHLLEQCAAPAPVQGSTQSVSACIYFSGDEAQLAMTLESLKQQEEPPYEVLIGVDADSAEATVRAAALAEGMGLEARVVEAFDFDAGLAFNRLAELAQGEFLIFLWAGATLRPHGLRALDKVAHSSGADVLNFFYRVTREGPDGVESYLKAIVIGSLTDAFFRNDLTSMPLLVRREAFRALNGFTSDYRVLCYDQELIAKAQLLGFRCETALLELGSVPAWDEAWLKERYYDVSASHFRAVRPQLAAVPLGMRDHLLMSKGLQLRGGGPRKGGPKKAAKPEKQQGAPLELANEGGFGRMLRIFLPELVGAKPEAGEAPAKAAPAKPANGGAPGKPPSSARRAAHQAALAGMLKLIDGDEPSEGGERVPDGDGEGARPGRGRPGPQAKTPVDERRQLETFLGRAGMVLEDGPLLKVLAVREGVIHGWALDPQMPDRTLEVELLIGERVRARVPANAPAPYALGAPPALQGHGFAIPVFAAGLAAGVVRQVRQSRLARMANGFLSHPVSVGVRIAGGEGAAVEALSVVPPGVPIAASCYRGYCDPNDNGVVQGWVWSPDKPHETVEVAVFADGRFLARVPADLFREDLVQNSIGSGAHGFRVPLDRRFRTGDPHRIDVVVADAGIPLGRGRLTVVRQKIMKL